MTNASTSEKTSQDSQPPTSPLAGLLSYLIPGLGQIYQGRVVKGVLFLVCLYSLFFYGMYLGSWNNVYLRKIDKKPNNGLMVRGVLADVADRLPFLGQFPIGVVAWPAIWQYLEKPMPAAWHDFMRTPSENRLNELQSQGDKFWDLGWVYTVIAGVLNILVIYDAFAGPAFHDENEPEAVRREEAAVA
jgi:TM2 domain-containing membrane protein YozV